MLDIKKIFNLQWFGEGDGGTPAADSGAETNAGENIEIPDSIPGRAKDIYKKAVEKTNARSAQPAPSQDNEVSSTEQTEKTEHIPFRDLIKSDEYKEEHKAYMDAAIADRFKKYQGIEQTNAKQSELLSLVAQKYGLDTNAENYLDTLQQSIEADDSYYENYAMQHDMTPQEARKIVSLERKVAENERQQKMIRELEERQRVNQMIIAAADKCKAVYPEFDLDTEWQNPDFIRLAHATNWDLTAAYRTTHWNELTAKQAQYVAQTATAQVANSVKANKSRPIENGLGSVSPSMQTKVDYSKMNLQEIRNQADEWRRAKNR